MDKQLALKMKKQEDLIFDLWWFITRVSVSWLYDACKVQALKLGFCFA